MSPWNENISQQPDKICTFKSNYFTSHGKAEAHLGIISKVYSIVMRIYSMSLSIWIVSIIRVTAGCFLTVIIDTSLEAFLIVQAMRMDAVVCLSFIYECHFESISFLCPQDWPLTKAAEQRKVLRELWKKRHQCVSTKMKWEISRKPGIGPYLRVPSALNEILRWWRYCLCTLCISLSCSDLQSFHRQYQKKPLKHYERKGSGRERGKISRTRKKL